MLFTLAIVLKGLTEAMDSEKTKGEGGSGSNKKIRLNKIFVKNLSENTTNKISRLIKCADYLTNFLLRKSKSVHRSDNFVII